MLSLGLIIITSIQLNAVISLTWNKNFDDIPGSWNATTIINANLYFNKKFSLINSKYLYFTPNIRYSIVTDPLDSRVKVLKIKHQKGSCSSTSCGVPGK
jgi:hypothetical protein